jgi:type IV pilus assembly protein PilY1
MKFIKYSNTAIIAAVCLIFQINSVFATAVDVSTPQSLVPPNITTSSNRPMLMLAASKDHSLFGPIYTDFEDLDGDGVIDTTFKPTFKYYGYFDATKCYEYNTTSNQFNPAAIATVVTSTTNSITSTRYTCPSTQYYWSGNFLNWSSMTRIDIIRKMLYGGKRSTDTTTTAGVGTTILERAALNFDAHSFVKYYRETDIRDYTPFSTSDLTKTTGSNANIYAGLSICNLGTSDSSSSSPNPPIMRMVKGNVRFWSTVEIRLCQWRENYSNVGTFGPKLARYYQDADKGAGGIAHEITIPSRTTDGATYNSIGPELTVRVKACDPNFLGEEHCQAFPATSTTNYKPYGLFQEFGHSITGGAARAEFGVITGSYDKNYTAGALRKNMGDFSDEINSSTGVFCHSASSGCATTLADGRSTGNGAIKTFDNIILNDRSANTYASSGTPSSVAEGVLSSWGNPMGEMLVQALQYYAYNGTTPTPTNPSSTTKDTARGIPTVSWQDPLSNSNSSRTTLYGNSVCRPMNVLLFSNSALSFDGQAATPFATLPGSPSITAYTDTVGVTEGFNNTLRSVGSVTGGYGTSCSAKTVGTLSNVSGICPEAPAMGGTYQVAGAALYGNTNQIRTISSPPSDLSKVKDALKVKTLAASLTGGAPRIDIPVPGTSPTKYVYITPESVQNGGGISAPLTFASISSSATHGAFIVTWNDILMGGDYDMDITGFIRYDIVDANGASNVNGPYIKVTTDIPGVCGGGAGTHGFSIIGVTDSANVSANGRYLTHQHYSSGILSGMPATSEYLCGDTTYRAKTSTLFSGTYATTVCNVTGNGATGDPTIPNLTSYCTVKNIDYPVSMTFKMVGESSVLIKDPLFYAAKYGDFDSSTQNSDGTYTNVSLPTSTNSWDSVINTDGTTGSDGVPDGYFLARRPDLLEQQLRKALDNLAKSSNSAPATTSAQMTEGNYKYVARFDSTTVTGNIEAYRLKANGSFETNYTWRAGQLLRNRTSGSNGTSGDNGNTRQIITNSGNKSTTNTTAGTAFRWASLPAAYITQMTTASTNTLSSTNAQLTLNYIRGDQTLENASTGLRVRGDNMLGPIVNATPYMQSTPAANFLESQYPGYRQFVTSQKSRAKLLWAGVNDGMLHAFNPDTGAEVFAYVPGTLANRLAEIPLQRGTAARTRVNGANFTLDTTERQPDTTVWAYVDGSPFTADVKTNIVAATSTTAETGTWRTYAFSTLGRGGKGFFALDVTDTATLTEGNANSIFKWQFTSDDDSDLGYIVNDIKTNANTYQPNPIVKLNNGKFGLILNNGYKSTNGKAVLYIIFVDGPSATSGNWIASPSANYNYVKIIADVGTGNGLSAPTWIDRDNNGTADVVYAGDLKGNMWKFDISNIDPSQWAVAYKTSAGSNRPLFTAQYTDTTTSTTTALPITTAPEYVYPSFDGLIINFGTGKSFETGDFPNTNVKQRFYGLWDSPTFTSTASTGTGPMVAADMSTLVTRTYVRDASTGYITATANSTTNGVSTYTAIDWATNYGWYFNLPGSGEALLSDPDISGGYLIFPTVRPKTTTTDCNSTPDASLYIIDPIAGRATRVGLGTTGTSTLISGIGVADQKWVTVSNRTSSTVNCTSADAGCTNIGSSGTGTDGGTKQACPDPDMIRKTPTSATSAVNLCYYPLGRMQWREIPGLRTDR